MKLNGILPILVALPVIAAFGVAHGAFTNRWARTAELQTSLDALATVPQKIGDWEGQELPKEDDLARMGIQGSLYRVYRNKVTQETVQVLMVCGRGGPICVHTPDVCYTGAGYRQLSEERRQEIASDQRDSFIVARFAKPNTVSPSQLEIYWAWSRTGHDWEGPQYPRLAFGRAPALYKLYVIREFIPGTKSEASSATQLFLQQALPLFRQHFSPVAF